MKHELLLVPALALDVAGVVAVFVTIARARRRGGGVLRHAGTSPSRQRRHARKRWRVPGSEPSASPNQGRGPNVGYGVGPSGDGAGSNQGWS